MNLIFHEYCVRRCTHHDDFVSQPSWKDKGVCLLGQNKGITALNGLRTNCDLWLEGKVNLGVSEAEGWGKESFLSPGLMGRIGSWYCKARNYCDNFTVQYRAHAIETHRSKYTNAGSQPPSLTVLLHFKASIIASKV